jgi:hypothetical protein
MTPHADFTALHHALAIPKYETEVEEKAKARARMLLALPALENATAQIASGNPDGMEAALAAQVHLLHVIFTEYSRIAARTTDIVSVQTYMRFAFKAQNQCRVTHEHLRDVKNTATPAPSSQNLQNEILPRRSVAPAAPPSGENHANELLALVRSQGPFVLGRSSRSEKSPNEILRSALMSGASAPSDPANPQNPPVLRSLGDLSAIAALAATAEGGPNEILAPSSDGPAATS